MLGSDSRRLDLVASAQLLTPLTPYFETGEFRPLPVTRRYPEQGGRPTRQWPTTPPAGS
jgi:NADPH2:quinone reductase